jgi:hypothetical protein
MLSDNTEIRLELAKIKSELDNQGKNITVVFNYLDELLEQKERMKSGRRRIGFMPDNLE